ncbi:heavy metal sensor histidine kinase [Enterobacter sp. MF024]|uniref:Cu(+)/Ag(+) sensor histidine kinase n=1 Tax=Enterobacter sp. MF024 TaxID=2555644 RepID=UPI001106977A|nr:Cu(+)/Ag(+) sensor histidine kinase [Enterobacter sp. MF024]TLU67006.1 heavy metal sensor histidine kinase [Enterobacter sp. MF024]
MIFKRSSRPFSLATRLTFFISLATIASFFVFTWIMIHSVKAHFEERDIHDMKQIGATLETVLSHQEEPEKQRLEILQNVVAGYASVSVMLLDTDDRPVFQSAIGPDLSAILRDPALASELRAGNVLSWHDPSPHQGMHNNEPLDNSTWRLMMLPIGKKADGTQAYNLLMALSINFHLHYINDLKNKLMIMASIISIIVIFIVLFAVYQGHKPIRSLSQQIKNISSADLGVRLNNEDVPIELERLVISFNHMIERIEDVFNRQANFSADLAHEMRTPITNLVTQTEIALSQPRSARELEEVMYSSLEEFSRMSKMVSDMLFLAQADNNQLIPEKETLDLAAEVTTVFDFFEALAEERGVALRLEGHTSLVEGDPLMLRRALSNLLSNAIRYTPRGGTITVHLRAGEGEVHIIVENPGTPIAPVHLPRLFDRFYRVDPSRQRKDESSSGIGLAIVKSIITAHYGRVSVESDIKSTRFILTLPAKHRQQIPVQ